MGKTKSTFFSFSAKVKMWGKKKSYIRLNRRFREEGERKTLHPMGLEWTELEHPLVEGGRLSTAAARNVQCHSASGPLNPLPSGSS